MASLATRGDKRAAYVAIALTYIAQGLPIGLAFNALGVLIRGNGHSTADVGLTGLAFLPWGLKILWAGPIDNLCARFGHGRVVAVTQALAIAICLALAQLSLADAIGMVVSGVVLLNLVSATQDIATNAYAVARLQGRGAGAANAIQVVGMIAGMLAGGGGLLLVHEALGWSGAMRAMAALLAAIYLPLLLWTGWQAEPSPPTQKVRLRDMVRHKDLGWMLALGLSFKFAGTAVSTLMQPWLIDRGMSMGAVGSLQIDILIANAAGGALIGLPLIRHFGERRAVLVALIGSTLLLGMAWALDAAQVRAPDWLAAAFALEALMDGAMYVAVWTLVMNWASPERPGTDFSALQCCESMANAMAAGAIAGLGESWGYGRAFAAAWGAGLLAAALIAFALPRISLNGERP